MKSMQLRWREVRRRKNKAVQCICVNKEVWYNQEHNIASGKSREPRTNTTQNCFTSMLHFNQTSHTSQIHGTAFFLLLSSFHRSLCMIWSDNFDHVQYDLTTSTVYNTIWQLRPCTIRSDNFDCVQYDLTTSMVYDINLGAMNTTILSTRGVTIPICFISSTTDSIRRHIVLFKPVTVPTSDPKSEFLCQSSSITQNLQTPPEPPSTPGIAPTPLSSCITLTPTNQVLSQSTLNRNYASIMLNVLVAAT